MKNIYILPTDKPSRLHFDVKLFLSTNYQLSKKINSIVEGRNIYITSDEEIKEGDWVYRPIDNTVLKCTKDILISVKQLGLVWNKNNKKIILTTDQELIKDGVQSITDDFLEWFVKNPTCKWIEYDKNYNRGNGKYYYKIIIPKEEPKQTDWKDSTKALMLSYGDNPKDFPFEELKQETLEEVIEKLFRHYPESSGYKKAALIGKEWQQERSYSEEDMIEASKYGYNFHKTTQFPQQDFEDSCIRNTQQWLEQFKKVVRTI